MALAGFDGKLIAAGHFDTAGGTAARNIAAWDGSNWLPLGSGTNDVVYGLTVHDNELVVGGFFTTAGDKVSAYIAIWTKQTSVAVDDDPTVSLPDEYRLSQNCPNPFNPTTMIEYNVPTRSHVAIEIFNLLGQRVATIVDEMKDAGRYRAVWDGTDAAGETISTGVYFYRLRANDFVATRKMLLVK